MKRIVVKFGGTSLGNAQAINRSAQISIDQNASIVVVSAVGGVTNLLVQLKVIAKNGNKDEAEEIIKKIGDIHESILKDMNQASESIQLEETMQSLTDFIDRSDENNFKFLGEEILACGELLSARLMVLSLNKLGNDAKFFDSREIIKTDDQYGIATPDIKEIESSVNQKLVSLLDKNILVTQGFIGSTIEGKTTTLGRGGSDFSSALIAEAIKADELQIWSDVAGIATTDPRLVQTAKHLDSITFQEAAELATAGAKILHARTISPARRANIPIYVRNSFDPGLKGTKIIASTDTRPVVRAITLKSNQSIIRITAVEMAEQFGYLAKILQVFADHRVVLDQISTSEITVAFGVDDTVLEHEELINDLSGLGEIQIENNVNAVSLIGNNINSTPGLIKEIFTALESEGDKISVRMICQGASKHNICFFVLGEEGEKAVKKLHKELIEK